MSTEFDALSQLARKRVACMKIQDRVSERFAEEYLRGISDELSEVNSEMKPKNAVHLEDELGDVLWDYLNLLVVFEELGYIRDMQRVVSHSVEKYTERFPAVEKGSSEMWDEIKVRQKKELVRVHARYKKSLL